MGKPDPRYDPRAVEQTLLIEAIEQRGRGLTVDDLTMRIVTDPDDSREMETARAALRSLKRSGLLGFDAGEPVEPTPAAIHAHALLAQG